MHIRPYADHDRQACLDILSDNTPEFFVPADRDSLCEFLAKLPGPYFVGEEQGAVVACGGWAIESADVVVLTWGMVRRDLHRRGMGRALLRFRLDDARRATQASVARLRTVQLVQGFFAKEGFRVTSVVPDGFGPGLDRVTMELALIRPTS
jgi:N-acetylglutamate synthase-like GNAT family acetyltransferase